LVLLEDCQYSESPLEKSDVMGLLLPICRCMSLRLSEREG
jgi:hypothetical protein